MAKKLDLSTSRKAGSYGDFTRNYRQSENVEDRRVSSAGIIGKQALYGSAADEFKVRERSPTQTPSIPKNRQGTATVGQGGSSVSETTPSGRDPFTGAGGNSGSTNDDPGPAGLLQMKPGQSRKVDPEEALKTTGSR